MKYRHLIPLLLSLLFLTGCGGDAPAEEPVWDMDRHSHWQCSSDGKKTQQGNHTVEKDTCTVCGAFFSTPEDGELQVQTVNDRGDVTRRLIYDTDGALAEDTRLEYTYDEAGLCTARTEYRFGTLYQETVYATHTLRQETVAYASGVTTWNEDGTRLVETYDPDGLTRETLYDGETTVHDYHMIREYDQHGRLHVLRKMENGRTLSETVHRYADDGQLTNRRVFARGRLVQEYKYKEVDGVWVLSKTVTYRSDGTTATVDHSKFSDILDAITN